MAFRDLLAGATEVNDEISVNHDNLNDCLQEYFKIESIPGILDKTY